MKVFLSHKTALHYWREHFPLDSELGAPAHVSGTERCASRKSDVIGAIPEEFIAPDCPVDVLIFNEAERRRSEMVACHAWRTSLPVGAFYRVRGIYISSPEFLFVQMAEELSIEQLIALGCELCGTYVLLPKGRLHPGSIDGHPKRLTPLTDSDKLTRFLSHLGKVRGKQKATRALKYIIDGSRSPMETMTYLLLCLPALLGGYGLPKPLMNARIELNEEARSIARRQYCEGDLCWPGVNPPLDIEYHGEVHVGAIQMKSDVGRELGIEHMGWRVITVTSPQVLDVDRFEIIAKDVASAVGKRLRQHVVQNATRRNALRHELQQWMFEDRRE